MNIGDLIGRKRRGQPVDGGIGGLTESEETELSDLLNGPHKICECGSPGCGSPISPPRTPGS